MEQYLSCMLNSALGQDQAERWRIMTSITVYWIFIEMHSICLGKITMKVTVYVESQ